MNLIVIDDFYSNPYAVRNMALHSTYRDVTRLNYPGFQSIKSYSSKELENKFSEILNCQLDINLERHTFGKFRIMLKETSSNLKVHLDGLSDWTGVLYLNPPEQCEGGTAFYKHKRTQLEGRANQQQILNLGYTNWNELEKDIIEPDTLNSNAWEENMFVAMKFNRLVLFKGNELFHSHTHSFGKDKNDGRMTQNFFFDEA